MSVRGSKYMHESKWHICSTTKYTVDSRSRLYANSAELMYEVCLESKDTKVLNIYNIFNLQKWYWECIACT